MTGWDVVVSVKLVIRGGYGAVARLSRTADELHLRSSVIDPVTLHIPAVRIDVEGPGPRVVGHLPLHAVCCLDRLPVPDLNLADMVRPTVGRRLLRFTQSSVVVGFERDDVPVELAFQAIALG